LIDPEEEDASEGDGGEEGVGASVVSCVDASPVLEASEEVLDFVSLPIERRVVSMLDFVQRMRGDAGGYAACRESLSEPERAIGAVGEHGFGVRQGVDERFGAFVIAALSFGQMETQWSPASVAHDMQLAGQAAAAASDTSG